MNEEFEMQEAAETEKKKKLTSPWLIMLLVVFLLLFLLTTAILGARLYEMTTRDRYTVDLGVGNMYGEIELFRIAYSNEEGRIVVEGANADNVVAPGTSVDYNVRLRNNGDTVVEFLMIPTVEFLTGDVVPVEFKMMDAYGNYLLGSKTEWVKAEDMNALAHKGMIYPGDVYTYHISWRWVFEVSDEQNDYDTDLGNKDGEVLPGVSVAITTEATANPNYGAKDFSHLTHLQGENFGCCWCCYIVWLLLLLVIVLLIWIFRLRRKLDRLEDIAEEYRLLTEPAETEETQEDTQTEE